MFYCDIENLTIDYVGDDYVPTIYYKGWSIPCEEVEKILWKDFHEKFKNADRMSKDFFRYIHGQQDKVFEILDHLISTAFGKKRYGVIITRTGYVEVEAVNSAEAMDIADHLPTDQINWSDDWNSTDADEIID